MGWNTVRMSIWDDRHSAPIVTSQSVDSINIVGRQRHIIKPGPGESFQLDCLIEPRETDVLVVALHGALDRSKYTLPRFEWMGTLQERSESLLFLSDTGLSSSQDLRISWYTGNAEDDLTSRYAGLISSMAEKIGAKKIALLGFSGGGFAALSMASLIPGSVAVAFSPQTSINKYYHVFSQAYTEALFSSFASMEEVEQQFPHRMNLVERYSKAGIESKFVYVQNTGDIHHMRHHYTPFRAATEGQVGSNFITSNESSTHSVPEKERILELLDYSISLC